METKLSMFDIFVAEGTELECAMYTTALLELLRRQDESNKEKAAKHELEMLEKFGSMTFEDLIRRERDESE